MESGYIKGIIKGALNKLEESKYENSEKTIELGLEVYSLCKEEKYETGMAVALLRIGQVYSYMSEYENAISYLFDCINLAEKQGICDLQLLSYLSIGNAYLDIEEYEKSLDYYNCAEKLAKIIDHNKNYYKNSSFEFYAAKIYNNIGEIYRILGRYEDAVKYYDKSDDFDKKFNYEATAGTVLSNLGCIEYHFGSYDKALEYLNQSIEYLTKYDYKIAIVEAYGILALTYAKKTDYVECRKYFFKAMEMSAEIDYGYNKIDVLLNFSGFIGNIGERELLISKLDELYRISIDKKLYAKTVEICKIAIKLYEEVDDVYNANKYYRLYFENQKKLENILLKNRAANLKTKLRLNKLEKEKKKILKKSESFQRKSEELIEIIKNISIISELGEKITTTLNLDHIFEMLHNTTKVFMQISFFGVALYDEENRKIHYPYAVQQNERIKMKEVSIDNESSMAAKCLRDKKTIVINDMSNEYLNYIGDTNYLINNKDSEELNSAIYCPLVIDNNLIGVMTVQCYAKDSFTMFTVEMIKALSSYAAIAINNAIKSINLLIEVKQRRKFQEELENINKKLTYLSENDGLTNIPNRRKFDAVINKEWNKAKNEKSPISIIIFDVDFFKQYNDNYGHIAGDNCLINISNELNRLLVKRYFAARYGGDEFVIILPDADLEEAMKYGENFRKSIEKLALPHEYSLIGNVVTVTLGVSTIIPSDDITITQFIRQADVALYKAKRKGRNMIEKWKP